MARGTFHLLKQVRALLPIGSPQEKYVEEGRLVIERSIELRMLNLSEASLADVTMG
jgi:hypothetical protein